MRGEGVGAGGESIGKYILWDSNAEDGCALWALGGGTMRGL